MQTHHPQRAAWRLVILALVAAALTGTLFAASPTITSLSPTSGKVGASVTIVGANFGSSGTVEFNGTKATTISSWSPTSIKVAVPVGATTGKVVVTFGGVASNGVSFTVQTFGGIIR